MKVCWYDLNHLRVGVGGRFKCETNSEWEKKKVLLHLEDGIWPITIYSELKYTIKLLSGHQRNPVVSEPNSTLAEAYLNF